MIEKILERLEAERNEAKVRDDDYFLGKYCAYDDAIKIVQEVAKEYGKDTNVRSNGWIPCSERLPKTFEDTKSSDVVLVCGYDKQTDYYWQAMGFYVKTDSIKRWFFAECKNTDKPIDWIDIIAWQPLPAPYQKSPSRCDTCTHYVADEVPPICYMCSKGIEDNYQKGE